jgi:hypothetical protein
MWVASITRLVTRKNHNLKYIGVDALSAIVQVCVVHMLYVDTFFSMFVLGLLHIFR